jgi:hypothetical protein
LLVLLSARRGYFPSSPRPFDDLGNILWSSNGVTCIRGPWVLFFLANSSFWPTRGGIAIVRGLFVTLLGVMFSVISPSHVHGSYSFNVEDSQTNTFALHKVQLRAQYCSIFTNVISDPLRSNASKQNEWTLFSRTVIYVILLHLIFFINSQFNCECNIMILI